eukprot:1147996-Pelagomonas_calceolata.AAC.5
MRSPWQRTAFLLVPFTIRSMDHKTISPSEYQGLFKNWVVQRAAGAGGPGLEPDQGHSRGWPLVWVVRNGTRLCFLIHCMQSLIA